MIINVWSTPRTGSVWYSFYQQSLYPDAIHSNEMFNRYHMGLYHKIENGRRLNLRDYEDGCFYSEHYIQDGVILDKEIYDRRTRSLDEEEQYRISLFDQYTSPRTIIVHNHVDPISEHVRQKLTEIADKNFYLYRKDKRAQLGSYVIASSTRQFVQFNDEQQTGIVNDVQPNLLENLIHRIRVWDSLTKNLDSKSEIIAYEDINFVHTKGFPKKQNLDYRQRLSENMLNLIDSLVAEYEQTKDNL